LCVAVAADHIVFAVRGCNDRIGNVEAAAREVWIEPAELVVSLEQRFEISKAKLIDQVRRQPKFAAPQAESLGCR
jgi:hypothetical protein